MDDGLLVPGQHDGMAAFAGPEGRTILVRNHELDYGESSAFGERDELLRLVDAARLYDRRPGAPIAPGATTTLVYDTRAGKLERHFLSLAGTLRNCAGGPTPWGTWISCEEPEVMGPEPRHTSHGYAFEVPASPTPGLAAAVPLKAMGRFRHEAIAVDPRSGIVYLTEDRPDGLFYRFVPNAPGRLAAGGALQALVILDRRSAETFNFAARDVVPVGVPLAAGWVGVDDVEAPADDLRLQGFAKGAARLARSEGLAFGSGALWIACTDGGAARKGQLWRYVPDADEDPRRTAGKAAGRLELFAEPNDGAVVDGPDNLVLAPWGDLFLCENGPGENFVRGVTPAGEPYPFARNAMNASEFAGATFAPDGTTLFVNMQEPGLTLAITGPWERHGKEPGSR